MEEEEEDYMSIAWIKRNWKSGTVSSSKLPQFTYCDKKYYFRYVMKIEEEE